MTDEKSDKLLDMGKPILISFARTRERGDIDYKMLFKIAIAFGSFIFLALFLVSFRPWINKVNLALFLFSWLALIIYYILMWRFLVRRFSGLSLYENGIYVNTMRSRPFFLRFEQMEKIILNPSTRTTKNVAINRLTDDPISQFEGKDEDWEYPSHRLNYENMLAESSILIFTKPGVMNGGIFIIYSPNIQDIKEFRRLLEESARGQGVAIIDEKGIPKSEPGGFWNKQNSFLIPADLVTYQLPYGSEEFEKEYGKVVYSSKSLWRFGALRILPVMVILFLSLVYLSMTFPNKQIAETLNVNENVVMVFIYCLIAFTIGGLCAELGLRIVALKFPALYEKGIMSGHTYSGDMNFIFFKNIDRIYLQPSTKTAINIVEHFMKKRHDLAPDDEKEDYVLTPLQIDRKATFLSNKIVIIMKTAHENFFTFEQSIFGNLGQFKADVEPLLSRYGVKLIDETNLEADQTPKLSTSIEGSE